jgi:hypothetical protein
MMEKIQKSEQSLKEIRDIMERSTTFVSLSGMSGVICGLLALSGAGFLWIVFGSLFVDESSLKYILDIKDNRIIIFTLFGAIFVLSISIAFLLSYTNAKKMNRKIFNSSSKRFAFNLFVPILTGGAVIYALVERSEYGMVLPVSLIFFGLSLIGSGRYSRREVIDYGIACVLSGVLGLIFTEFGILLWAIGFGVMNILTGITMYLKYDKAGNSLE